MKGIDMREKKLRWGYTVYHTAEKNMKIVADDPSSKETQPPAKGDKQRQIKRYSIGRYTSKNTTTAIIITIATTKTTKTAIIITIANKNNSNKQQQQQQQQQQLRLQQQTQKQQQQQ
jgi:hypothetical protein